MDREALIEVIELSGGYGKIPVLYNVNIVINKFETICVLGANGAGKTTLLCTITGILKPSKGRVIFDGEDVTGFRPERLAGKGLSLILQGRSVFPSMTVQENLDMGAYLLKNKTSFRDRLDKVFDLFPILSERRAQKAGSMSGGEQKMLEVGRILMLQLKLLLLDEPSLGLAPKIVDLLFDTVHDLSKSGMTILLVEQNAFKALEISDRGYVLELGRIKLEGTRDALTNDAEIRKHYLGT